MNKFKILHIINTLTLGGAETLLIDSLRHMKKNYPEIENHIITLTEKGFYADLADKEFIYNHFQISKLSLLGIARKVKQYSKANNIAVIHAHLFEASIISRFAKGKGLTLINTYHTGFHNPDSIEYKKSWLVLDKFTLGKVDGIIFVSNKVKDDISAQLPIQCKNAVVPNFCSPDFSPLYNFRNDDKLRLVSIGNLREQKNHMLALEALKSINDPNISLDIYGEGPLRKELEDYIHKNRLSVTLHGKEKISSRILALYDLFLMTSKHEGMPISLIESIVSGLPSLLNELSELKETAKDSAIYFEKDSRQGLIDKLKYIKDNKHILADLSGKTLALKQTYQIENYIKALFSFYEYK